MNPWTIIGWIVLAILTIPILLLLLKLFLICNFIISHQIAHWKTRNDKPEKGQRWVDRSKDLIVYIKDISENGTIHISSERSSWGESPEGWAQYVRGRKLRRTA